MGRLGRAKPSALLRPKDVVAILVAVTVAVIHVVAAIAAHALASWTSAPAPATRGDRK